MKKLLLLLLIVGCGKVTEQEVHWECIPTNSVNLYSHIITLDTTSVGISIDTSWIKHSLGPKFDSQADSSHFASDSSLVYGAWETRSECEYTNCEMPYSKHTWREIRALIMQSNLSDTIPLPIAWFCYYGMIDTLSRYLRPDWECLPMNGECVEVIMH